jgi:CheY-like chemotaxis protein
MKLAKLDNMPSILVVDDDADGREVVSQFLTRSGYRVRSSPNGRAALISLSSEIPDVVILDLMMPEMSGVEFLRIIRSYLRWQTLPVIVLTAYPTGDHIDQVRQMGVKCIFTKANYQLADLLKCVNKIRDEPNSDCMAC